MRHRSRNGLTAALLALVTLAGAIFLFAVGIDALEGRSEFQFFADSGTYHEAARGDLIGLDSAADVVGIAGNFLGPLLVLRLTGENYYLVLLANAVLMFLSIASISRTLKLDSLRLAALLLLNPLTISSLLAVNKEILSLVFVAVLLRGFATRSWLLLGAAGALSLLVRWQLMLVLLLLVPLVMPAGAWRGRRRLALLGLLAGLSALYVVLLPVFEPIRATFELSVSEYEGSGFYEWLVGWQDAGAYWAVFPVKAAHLLFGLGLRVDRLLAPANMYNDVWQLLHSSATLLMFVALWRAGRLRLDNDIVFISAIYIAVFALSPIYSPRYFYPVYVLWAVALVAMPPALELRSLRRRRHPRRPSAATSPGPLASTNLPFGRL
jgi:hypothetical protein